MDIITLLREKIRTKTTIMCVIKGLEPKNVVDRSQYRPIARLSKWLDTLAAYQKIKVINRKSYPLVATVNILVSTPNRKTKHCK